jgi:hypothetical protein
MTSDSGNRDQPPAELARRLRDEVRAEAQREADAIISKARTDIKEIVSSAYAELLVLRAQVQAISDEKVDQTLPASMQQFEVEAENLRRQLGHSGVEETVPVRAALPEPESPPVFAASYAEPPARRPSRRIVPMAAALALIAVAALWFFVRSGGEPDPLGTGTTAVPPAAAETPAAPPVTTPEPTTEPTPVQPAAEPPAADAAADAPPAEAARAFPAGTVTLELSAMRAVWVRAEVDGNVDNGRIYNPGDTWTLGPATSVALRVGDGGALSVSLNGAAPVPAGADGVVVNRRYGDAPAAAPAPAPAEEPPPPAQPATIAAGGGTPRAPAVASAPASTPAPSPSPASSIPRAVTPPPAAAAAAATPPPADPAARLDAEIRALDRRWFEATYRGDEVTLRQLRAPSFQMNDSRGPLTRPPQGATVQRALGRAGVTMVGDDAVLAGRMIETAPGGMPLESLFSEIWVRSGGAWQLSELRIQPAPPASQP